MHKLHLAILLSLISVIALAQPGALDLTFNPGTGADTTVDATLTLPDGKIVIGGEFLNYNGQGRKYLARLNPNGSLDTTFAIGTGPGSRVFCLALQSDGKLLVGGDFAVFNGDSILKIIRLLPGGAPDPTFRPDTFLSRPKEIVVQPDGKIIVAGSFASVNGLPYINLARLHSNGKLDTSFNTLNALNGTVETLALQPDGKLLIGGSFTRYFGVQGYRIARVNTDGSADTTFNMPLGGAGANVNTIKLLPDGRILMGGAFTFYNGSTVGHVACTFPDGTIDFSYLQNPAANRPVFASCLLPNGNYLVGGDFTSYQSNPAPGLASTTPDGVFDPQFNPGTGVNNTILSLVLDTKNKIMACGFFTTYNSVSRRRIARLYNCLTPQPDSIYGSSYALCSGTPQIYSVTPVADATRYEWVLPSGWQGTSDSASIVATGTGTGGTISVKAFTDSCGYSYATVRTIETTQPNLVPICLVTVDTNSTHNILIWEKPASTIIDSFIIYRQTATNLYTRIAAVQYDSLSEYHDMAANPNITSYRYKLAVLDTCGAESDLSAFHNTIHLQNFGLGNFQWTFYQIENQLNPVLNFNVYRDNLGNGNFLQIGNVPGTNSTFTDINYSIYDTSVYVVDVNWNISCSSSRAVNTTRSNIKLIKQIDTPIIIGITEPVLAQLLAYPNPTSAYLHLTVPEGIQVFKIDILNNVGQTVSSFTNQTSLSTEQLPAGFYTLQIATNRGQVVRKVIIQK